MNSASVLEFQRFFLTLKLKVSKLKFYLDSLHHQEIQKNNRTLCIDIHIYINISMCFLYVNT